MKFRSYWLWIFAFTIIVSSCNDEELPEPVATATPASQVINSGETTSINLTSNIEGTTFSWTVVEEGVTGASAGTGNSISQTLTPTGSSNGTATYTVVPTAAGVTGKPITVVVSVNVVKITYVADVKPIMTASCAPCHVAGGSHPGKWDDYAATKSKINSILNRVKRDPGTQGFMPRNGSKLPANEIAILEKWLADGLLEN